MGSRAVRPIRFLLLLASACFYFCWAAVGIAQAEPEPFTPPAEHFSEPEPLVELGACPSAPVAGIEEEEAGEVPLETRELGHLRLEGQEACKAVADRLDEVVSRLWWVTVEQAETVRLLPTLESANPIPTLETLLEPLPEIRNKLDLLPSDGYMRASLLGAEDEHPLAVSSTGSGSEGGPESAELVASIDSGAEASKTALYLIAGEIVALVIGFAIWRTGALRA